MNAWPRRPDRELTRMNRLQAAAICFLAAPEASYLTGYVLPVSGGTPI